MREAQLTLVWYIVQHNADESNSTWTANADVSFWAADCLWSDPLRGLPQENTDDFSTSVISASRHPAAQRKIGPDRAWGPQIADLVVLGGFLFFLAIDV